MSHAPVPCVSVPPSVWVPVCFWRLVLWPLVSSPLPSCCLKESAKLQVQPAFQTSWASTARNVLLTLRRNVCNVFIHSNSNLKFKEIVPQFVKKTGKLVYNTLYNFLDNDCQESMCVIWNSDHVCKSLTHYFGLHVFKVVSELYVLLFGMFIELSLFSLLLL